MDYPRAELSEVHEWHDWALLRTCTNWLEMSPPSWQSHRFMYAAAVGGVWRSSDQFAAYPYWEPLTDDLAGIAVSDRPGLQHVGCIALDRFAEGVIYAGTGDRRRSTLPEC